MPDVVHAGDVDIGAAVYRCEAHCSVACELYGAGRVPEALLQAARPMTDIFPWAETELRSGGDALKGFMDAVAAVGSGIRRGTRPRPLRKTARHVAERRDLLLKETVGAPANTPAFGASVAVALFYAAADSYAGAVAGEDLAPYQSAYGYVVTGMDLLQNAAGKQADRVRAEMAVLKAAFPAAVPPSQLIRPETLASTFATIASFASEALEARFTSGTLSERLAKVHRVLEDVVRSYEHGETALAARLSASLFVRIFDPLRDELATADRAAADRLTDLLGVRLRTAINDRVPPAEVAALGREITALLGIHGGVAGATGG